MPGIWRKIERITFAQNMHFAGLRSVEGEFAFEAVIGFGAVVVCLEIWRVSKAGTNRHFKTHHVNLRARTVDPVRDVSRLLIAP